MLGLRFTREEVEVRQARRGYIDIDTVLDLMCFEQPSLTPEEAAFELWSRYPDTYSYQGFLKGTRRVQEIKESIAKYEAEHGRNRRSVRFPYWGRP